MENEKKAAFFIRHVSLRMANELSRTIQPTNNQTRLSKTNISTHLKLKPLSTKSNYRISHNFIEHGSTTQTTLRALANWSRKRTRL
ncbi:hypothetical protein Smp_173980 [Schistosoma mansoni]|uniref:hypothetical protein n=1 Tax=Schistosoma mansoni TaxID=6183 RepID=UPI0001A61CE6|nr:hypothetical protein Smp_173980 [Schistosoma mansoni]|eukprot:XP_018645292.1 hypothetical protein Smp_173980 [Schistosoma mansoni]